MQAVIVAGGKGTRLRPLTYQMPKPLVPLFDRPFLVYLIERCRSVGITDIILNIHYAAHQIQEVLGDGSALGVKIRYSIETTPLDTCGAVKLGGEFFSGESLLVFNADILTELDLKALIQFHKSSGGVGTIALVRVEDPTAFGLVELDAQQKILSFREKPTAAQARLWGIDTINAGTYVLEPEVFARVPEGTSWSFERQLFPELVASAPGMYGFLSTGYWLDIGNPAKYLQAHVDVLQGKLPYPLDATEVQPQIWASGGVTIDPQAHLIPPVYLGAQTQVGPGAKIGPSVVVGANSLINGPLSPGIYPPGTLVFAQG